MYGSAIFSNQLVGGLHMIVTARVPAIGSFSTAVQAFGLSCTRAFSRPMTGSVSPCFPEFIPVDNKEWAVKNISEGSIIRVVSYNVLAQVYVKSKLFPHSPSHCLKWKARSQSLLALLKSLEANFLCLQELDEFETFYKGNMDKEGYSSVYIQRSGRKRDGCGIFYKRERTELILEETIDYNDLVPANDDPENSDKVKDEENLGTNNSEGTRPGSPQTDLPEDRGDPNDRRVRLKRDCVGLLTAFKLLEPPHHVIVLANTHIYWDPDWADVKLAQAKYLLLRVTRFKDAVSERFSCKPIVIVAGDFNSQPGDEVYRYLTSGISESSQGYSSIGNEPEASERSPIALHSLYSFIGGEPPFTNCTPGFTGTLDYILFSNPEHMQPVSFLKLPSAESPDIQGGLPNENHPSDHLPIGADFEIR